MRVRLRDRVPQTTHPACCAACSSKRWTPWGNRESNSARSPAHSSWVCFFGSGMAQQPLTPPCCLTDLHVCQPQNRTGRASPQRTNPLLQILLRLPCPGSLWMAAEPFRWSACGRRLVKMDQDMYFKHWIFLAEVIYIASLFRKSKKWKASSWDNFPKRADAQAC